MPVNGKKRGDDQKEKGATEMRIETWEFEEGPLRFNEKNDYRTLRRTLVRAL